MALYEHLVMVTNKAEEHLRLQCLVPKVLQAEAN